MLFASLKTDPVHGLNTASEVCFWCTKHTGRRVIHGLRSDAKKAPTAHYRDYTPCKNCESVMSVGITFIQCSDTPNDNQVVGENLYPTGVWIVIKEGWVREVFKEDIANRIIADKVVNIPMDLWNRLKLPSITNTGVESHILEYKETTIITK